MTTETEIDMRGRLTTPAKILSFMHAGNATLTIRSVATQTRFTYRITRKPKSFWDKQRRCFVESDDQFIWLVSLMNGPDNENSFQYMGKMVEGGVPKLLPTAGSKVSNTAGSWLAFCYLLEQCGKAMLSPKIEVWHEGRCGRCGRKLTVPESIERGIGPDCLEKM